MRSVRRIARHLKGVVALLGIPLGFLMLAALVLNAVERGWEDTWTAMDSVLLVGGLVQQKWGVVLLAAGIAILPGIFFWRAWRFARRESTED
jgi:hypothetical protein